MVVCRGFHFFMCVSDADRHDPPPHVHASFSIQVYTFEKGTSGQGIYRIIAVGGVIAFCVWAYNQPTDFDTFIAAQSDFMSDLYAGKLISDVSQVNVHFLKRCLDQVGLDRDIVEPITAGEGQRLPPSGRVVIVKCTFF